VVAYRHLGTKIRDEGDLLAVTEEELANDIDSDAEYVP
jgi:hypothetical protein